MTVSVVVVVWTAFLACFAISGVLLWRGMFRREHVHIPIVLLLADPFLAVMGCVMTFEWLRERRRGK